MNVLPLEKQIQIIACLVDGTSIRAASRINGVHQDTISRLALAVGEGCVRLHDARMRGLDVNAVQLDEQHSYVHTRQVNLADGAPEDHGETWTFAALGVASRAVVAYLVGKRSAENAQVFAGDVRARVNGRPTISADGLKAYVEAVDKAFGADVDFGQLVKMYAGDEASVTHNGHYKGAVRVKVSGDPNWSDIHTSYIERVNLTTRMSLRRFTRKTNGFSKRLRNHAAAVALHYAHYNWGRVHETLRCTPAMELGVEDHVWSIGELIERALSAPEPPPFPPPPGAVDPSLPRDSKWHGVTADRIPHGRVGTGRTVRPTFTVIKGGID